MQSTINFKSYLSKRWNEIYTSPDANFILRGDIEKIKIKQIGNYYLLLNQSLKKKRVIQIDNKLNSVSLNFDPKPFNFNKVTQKEILFYVNFDNQQIVTKEQALKLTEQFLDQDIDDNKDLSQNHPLIINVSPVCRNHSILTMFPQQELPQIIGTEVILMVLNIFKLTNDLIIGYNSIGANAVINHLHFHFIYPQDLIKRKILPIQKVPRKIFYKTTLNNPKQKVNMYNVGVILQQVVGTYIKAIVLSPLDPKSDQPQIYSSLSYVFGLVINQLLQNKIAHNVIFAQRGYNIYIFPRLFKHNKQSLSWIQLSGVMICQSEQEFKKINEGIYQNQVKSIQIENTIFQNIKKKIIKLLQIYL